MTATIQIKLAYGDLECLYMPQENIDTLFGPFGRDNISPKDYRLTYIEELKSYAFDGDEHDWRIAILEISLSQKLIDSHNALSNQLEVIHSHIKHLRNEMSYLLDPQRTPSNQGD